MTSDLWHLSSDIWLLVTDNKHLIFDFGHITSNICRQLTTSVVSILVAESQRPFHSRICLLYKLIGHYLVKVLVWPLVWLKTYWDNVWKSQGCIMVNGVLMEVPTRPKPEGPQAPRVFGQGNSRGTQFTMINPRLFHTFSFFRHPGLVKSDFFQPLSLAMDSLRSIMDNICSWRCTHW